MEPEIQGYLTELGILRKQIHDAVQGLNDEAANRKPLPRGTNSIYSLLSHTADVDNFWIRQAIHGESLERDRARELEASGHLADLISRWEKVSVETDSILDKLSLSQLAETRSLPFRPERPAVTVRWIILHVISHNATHLGHIQLTRQLWEQRNPI